MDHLLPCPGCTRHVRASDSLCPFCGEIMPLSLRGQKPVLPGRRLGRAATFAFGAALAATGCGDGTTGDPDTGVRVDSGGMQADGGTDAGIDGGVAPLYGGPVDDAGPMMEDGGGVGPLYGGPVADSGPVMQDGGGVAPAYGTPAPVDAGETSARDAGGGITPLYGAPPTPEDR